MDQKVAETSVQVVWWKRRLFILQPLEYEVSYMAHTFRRKDDENS